MFKRSLSIFLALILFSASIPVWAATYYVRPGGSTATNCTGLVNVDYDGSGTGEDCAFNHPFWLTGVDANCGNTSGAMSGGDHAIVYPKIGGYDMGYGAPNTAGSTSFPWDCHMKPIPSGSDSSHKTQIWGSNYAACSNISSATELYGKERTYWVIDLTSSASNIDLRCLNVTDHSECRYDSSLSDGDACNQSSYPYGDYAVRGLKSSYSSNIHLEDLWIHGMASEGESINNAADWTRINVNDWGNANINVNFNGAGNSGTTDQPTGTIAITGGINAFSGCTEKYPTSPSSYYGITIYDPKMCCSSEQSCTSDGLGTNSNGATWIVDGATFIHNVSDGLDLLYHDTGAGTVTVKNSAFIDNSGNQLKFSGNSTVTNNIIVGGCDFFNGKAYTWTADGGFTDNCRSGGDDVSLTFQSGTTVKFYGNTILSSDGADAFTVTGRGVTCDASNVLDIRNVVASSSSGNGWIDIGGICSSSTRTQTQSNIYNFSTNPTGTGNVFTNPLLTSGTFGPVTVSGALTSSSPGRDIADETASGQPSTDINGASRGASWDAGAVQFTVGSTSCTSCKYNGGISITGKVSF